jgi:hypothetical protein
VGESVSFPEQCCEGEDCGAECTQLSVAAEGAYSATIAYADVTEAEAADCLADAVQCPIEPFGTEPVEQLELDFELGAEPVVLQIPAEEPAAVSCDDYTRAVTFETVPITITNRRDTAVVLGGVNDGCPEYVAITSLDEAAPGSFSGWGCGGTCSSAHQGSFTCGACVTANAIVLDPGESTELDWPGLLFNQVPFAQECCDDGSTCYGECAMPSAPAPGPFSATVKLVQASDEEATACRDDGQGCPLLPQNGAEVVAVEMPFDFTGGAIELEIPAP